MQKGGKDEKGMFYRTSKNGSNARFNRQIETHLGRLYCNKNTSTFLFGSRSEFNNLCLEVVTKLKEKYPNIQRIYHRAEYPYISQEFREYLLTFYDDTFFDDCLLNAGKSVYVKRNKMMIDSSDLIVFYCSPTSNYKSGTEIAYKYALSKKKTIINLFESNE